ncbi:portal protein [Desulfovibrio inopinatus]|uniref:portal protein n=1 Tax=Desulfovibrio inopinatus TaxID=102109 RepID=UPI00040D1D5F|nr:hypothetical protein [Desulfovibrio inopinatus]
MFVQSNTEYLAELEAQARAEDQARQAEQVAASLAAYVEKCWQAAKNAKSDIEEVMFSALRQRNGEYDPGILEKIGAAGGTSTIYMMLTDEKCTAAASWLEDILLPADDKAWGTRPTPVPDVPPQMEQAISQKIMMNAQQIMMQTGQQIPPQAMQQLLEEMKEKLKQQVEKVAASEEEKIEREIEDVLLESNFRRAFREFIDDLVTFPAAFLKGPFIKLEKRLVWGANGERAAEDTQVLGFERVSPFDIFPAPLSRTMDDGYIIERHRFTRSDLLDLRGLPAFNADEIDMVLMVYRFGVGGLRLDATDTNTREYLEGRRNWQDDPEGRLEALQFWGRVQGSMLLEYGMDDSQIPDPLMEYDAEVWIVGGRVIKAELNGDPLGRRPYHKACLRNKPGSFWGQSIPQLIRDVQDVCNAAARNLVDNVAMSSGPQVMVDVSALQEGEPVEDIRPWRVWPINRYDMGGASAKPIEFYQPPIVVNELMALYQWAAAEADNKSGIPKYSYGQGGESGALKTATGLSMMMKAATKQIQQVVRNIDNDVVEPVINRVFEYLIYFFNKPYRGDIKLIARGSSGVLVKEQLQVRRNEFLQLVLSSPIVHQIVGDMGIAELLRAHVRDLDINADDVVPTPEQIQQQAMMRQMQMMQMARQQQAMAAAQGKGQPGKPQKPQQLEASGATKGGKQAALFGGARAMGGPVEEGQAYLVGEDGPEIIVPDEDGTVIPNANTFQSRDPSSPMSLMGDSQRNAILGQLAQRGEQLEWGGKSYDPRSLMSQQVAQRFGFQDEQTGTIDPRFQQVFDYAFNLAQGGASR